MVSDNVVDQPEGLAKDDVTELGKGFEAAFTVADSAATQIKQFKLGDYSAIRAPGECCLISFDDGYFSSALLK